MVNVHTSTFQWHVEMAWRSKTLPASQKAVGSSPGLRSIVVTAVNFQWTKQMPFYYTPGNDGHGPRAKGADLTPLTSAFVTCTTTFGLACRFRVLDMRWPALDRAIDLSSVLAQGDAAFQAFFATLS